jgi:hypothetical protein
MPIARYPEGEKTGNRERLTKEKEKDIEVAGESDLCTAV